LDKSIASQSILRIQISAKKITEVKRGIIKRRKEKRMKYSPATERRMKLVKAGKVIGGIAFTALYAML
jgi:exopolyphosphatase/pppGpp-phosphohydrolase